jgi:hypothetical protein
MLTIGACKRGAGTDAQEYTLCYPSWQALMCFDVCSSVCDTKYHMYGTCECRSPMGCGYKPVKMPLIVAVEWALEKFHNMHESGLSQGSVLTVLCNDQLLTTTHWVHICF